LDRLYLENAGDLPVLSKVQPGEVVDSLRFCARRSEPMEQILADFSA